ncbi:MAG TPA: carotenoid oxygenase family protein, partial [Solirubrobacterales bacterium]|nr:carotenoid oxygenase family protein [Solirubrobacterales bacterium]
MWGQSVEAIARPGYLAGIATLDSEVSLDSLPVQGRVPGWLDGTLVRNGPAMFEAGDIPLRHWFDGLAMLSRFCFDRGRVSYANRFLRSKAYGSALRGDISFSEFATDPPRSLLKRAATMLKPVYTDNCSFGVARVGEELVAMTETPARIPFDPLTLESGEVSFLAPGQHVVAHPHHDPATGESFGLATQFGRRTKYRVYSQAERSGYRVLAELQACEPSYMHSFAMTERYFVLTACPFVVNPLQLGFSSRPFIENFRWRPEEGTKFHVFERATGELAGSFETD